MDINEYLDAHKRGAEKSKGPTNFTKLLWWCAGADHVLLKISPMKDRVKYAGIGGIVLCTGLLAAFSGGYAFYMPDGTLKIAATEACKIDDLDAAVVQKQLDDSKARMGSATPGSEEHAVAQIEVEANTAMAQALGVN